MLKRLAAILLVLFSLTLTSCSVSPTTGLKAYVDDYDGYEFLYPNSWIEVNATNLEPDVIFHDLIESSENVSVILNPLPNDKTLADLGTPTDIGYRLSKSAIAPPGSNRQAELTNAEQREFDGKTYYLLEYDVKLPQGERHNLASIAISRGQLFTLNVSTTDKRWSKMQEQLKAVANSFHVY
ncbi:MAG TPA: photosystem II reaction center PsbP family protein [Oscillatoriales cyanobacterium M59_W2019_021]|nr:MAG: photosystem II oxygen evolving complex protein PsbP [Cyanobacteria bacterium J055]HIK33168.1 photosystem II reaction center PsbP family protein [Oscillatoriales cyanobacterium M4454_W2019_049]HIK50485.1 photosystem II reaction center PsbP family protein [Oscillatoriales cyanobacterium M59_W2019_021]